MIRPEEWQVLRLTVVLAALSNLSILAPGLALAWVLARGDWPAKSLVETIVTLPLAMPPVATGLILLKLLGRRGVIGKYLHESLHFDIAFTWRAVVIAMAVMSFPLLVRTCRTAFAQVDPRLEQIARTLGASDPRVFFTITLPLARRGVVAGSLLAFARALGEFGATIMVAGNIPGRTSTLPLAIYHLVQLGQDAQAYRMMLISILITFAAVWLGERLVPRGKEGGP